jgi:hypothetical protein
MVAIPTRFQARQNQTTPITLINLDDLN